MKILRAIGKGIAAILLGMVFLIAILGVSVLIVLHPWMLILVIPIFAWSIGMEFLNED